MSVGWHARVKGARENERNPISGAFFADEAIDKPAQALVRELLQNARDARAGDAPVRVRMHVHERLTAPLAKTWLNELWPQLQAPDSGVRDVGPQPGAMRYLVIEDFGTHGLTGDPMRTEAPPEGHGREERYFAFVRAEGYTNKDAGRGGSWGVGKTVFARSSNINTILGLSVRKGNPSAVLFGQCILKYRTVGGQRLAPEMMWGEGANQHEAVAPVSDGAILDGFRRDFLVTRTSEPGLSIVVPNLNESITASALLEHTMREYFLPILRGQLVVEITGEGLPGGSVTLDDRTLGEHLRVLTDAESLKPLIDLAAWSRSAPPMHETPRPELGVPTWEQVLPDADAAALGKLFERGQRLAIRVCVNVRRRDGAVPGHFDVLLVRATDDRACMPAYIRDGIVIPKVRDRGMRSMRVHAIVLCEDKELAAMLRDAEGPGHTHWSVETQGAKNHFRATYVNGVGLINLVESAPRSIAERLLASLKERDTTTFAEDFPMPVDEEARRARRRKKKKDPGPQDPEKEPVPAKPRAFTIEERKGGFVIRHADKEVARPERIHVRVGYARTRGNPFTHYHGADFKLNQAPIKVAYTGCRELTRHENVLKVEVTGDEFRVEVSGFDVHRDVEVDAKAAAADGNVAPEPEAGPEGGES